MDLWHAIVLGLVEGITEFLPISSTGHLIIGASLMGLDDPARKPAVDAFNIVIQGGAILAVLGLYRVRVGSMIRGVIGRDPAGLRLAMNLVIAFIPAGVLGYLLDEWIEARLFNPGAVMAALALGGVYMLAVDRWARRRAAAVGATGAAAGGPTADPANAGGGLESLRPSQALAIGLLQCVAMWPGTSRSMMTITGGMLVGLRPAQAAEFSFLLGLPTLGGATVYKALKNSDELSSLGAPAIAVGVLVAMISAAAAIRWLVAFLNRRGLPLFAWYRFGLCGVMLGLWMLGWVSISR